MVSTSSAPPSLDMSFNSVLGCHITLSPDRTAFGHRRNTSSGSVYSDDSDDTINISDLDDDEDVEGRPIGFPLQRMVQYDELSSGSSRRGPASEDAENQIEDVDGDTLAALYRACMAARLESNHASEDAGSDSSDSSSVAWDDVDFEELVDSLPESHAGKCEEPYAQLLPSSHHASSVPLALQSLRLSGNSNQSATNSSSEYGDDSSTLLLFLALNTPELRSDPWNPVPRILRAVERIHGDPSVEASAGSTVYLFHPPLVPFTQESETHPDEQEDQGTVAQWIDFFRQVLEGLAFLHENGVVWSGFDAIEPLFRSATTPCRPPGLDPSDAKESEMFMMDISADPEAFAFRFHAKWTFDRSRYPVKYYFTNFRRARQIPPPAISTSAPSPFTKDVQSCGLWLEALVKDIHLLHLPLLPLTQAMTSGAFTADGARKLFEARVRSLNLMRDEALWDHKVPSVRWRPLQQPSIFPAEEFGSDVKRSKTIHTARTAGFHPSRPGFGDSRTRVTEAAHSTTVLHPPPSITRSKSSPISILQENPRKEVFGDLGFIKSVAPGGTMIKEPTPVRPEKNNDADSEVNDAIASSAPPGPFSFLNSTNSHSGRVSSSPVFTIPSLVSFPSLPSLSPLPSLPELLSSHQSEQNFIPQTLKRRKTLALGTGIFSRKASQYAPSLGAAVVEVEGEAGSSSMNTVVISRPTSLIKIGRSISMPMNGSGTWGKS